MLDQSFVNFQISVIDYDTATGQSLHYFIEEGNGELPPGLSLSDSGLISGLVEPSYAIKISDGDGSYDAGYFDNVAYDFGTRPSNGYASFLYDQIFYDYSTPTNPPKKLNRNYEFILSVTDGDTVARQKFRMFVVSDDFFRADNTFLPAGTGVYKADGTFLRAPIWKTPSYLGIVRANNYVIEKLDIYEPGGDAVIIYDFVSGTLPPGMEFDENNGEIFGVVPYQPAVTKRYTFTVSVTRYSPQITESAVTNQTFIIDVQGEIDSVIAWESSSSLGTLPANFISNLKINANSTVDGATLIYTLESGRLPPGLTLKPDGEITGKVNQYGDVNKLGLTRFYDSTITEIVTTTSLTTSTTSPRYGANLVLTALVNPTTASGTVTFRDGATVIGTKSISNGLAEFIINTLTVGAHQLTATFNRFEDYKSSTSSQVSLTVAQGLTFINLTSSTTSSLFGNTITLSAVVTSPGGIPTGTVTFRDGSTVINTASLVDNQASITVNTLLVGNRAITAVYNSDGNFSSVVSATVLIVVSPQIGTTSVNSLTITPLPSSVINYGTNLTLRGTVSPATEGVIIFKEGTNILGSSSIESVVLGGVTATSTTGRFSYTSGNSLAVGQQVTISGVKTGTANIVGYTNPKIYYIKSVDSATTFTLTNTPGGSAITTTAGTVTGLTFRAFTGVANFITNKLGAGSYLATATFSGNSFYASIDSGTTPIVVNKITTAISFIASTNTPVYGNPFILEARVTANFGVPTGTITIKEGVTTLGVITLENRLAIFTSSNRVTVGSHTYTAQYSGDSNFNSSTSFNITIVVQAATVPYSANGISSSAITAELGGARPAQYTTWTLGSNVTLRSTGLPYHSFGNVNDPNIPAAQNYNVSWVYRAGTFQPVDIHVAVANQIIGFWLNGVAMYGPGNAGYAPIGMQLVQGFTYNASSEVQVELNYTFGADAAGGHTLPNGKYHYHDGNFLPVWLSGAGGGNELPQNSTGIADKLVIPYLNDGLRHINGHSKILGVAADGYPVYGPWGYINPTNSNTGLRKMISGYALKDSAYRAGTAAANIFQYPMGMFVEDFEYVGGGDLDEHNGRYCVTPDFPNGTYAYFITVDNDDNPVFPYVIGNTFFSTPGDLGS